MADCDGADAMVAGAGNHVRFNGPCAALRVSGDGNFVEVQLAAGAIVTVTGARNRIVYAAVSPGPEPVILSAGADNEVSAVETQGVPEALLLGPPPASAILEPAKPTPEPTAIVVDGDRQDRVIDCTDRDVVVHGSFGRTTLNGGCRSVSVQGRNARVDAVLRPGARVMIGGPDVEFTWSLSKAGAPPTLAISGTNSRAAQR